MPATSGSYNFQSITTNEIIRESFELIEKSYSSIVEEEKVAALRSLNFLLAGWSNESTNLWTLVNRFISLQPGQATYQLPIQTVNVIQAEYRTFVTQINVVPTITTNAPVAFSSQGNAANAFDNNNANSCTQTNPNGYIGYDYGVSTTNVINYIGIQSANTLNYTISFEASNDNITYIPLLDIPPQLYDAGISYYFPVDNIDSYRYYRIVGNGGSVLNINKLFFNNISAFSSSGNAANAFGNSFVNPLIVGNIVPCSQTQANGYIVYDYGAPISPPSIPDFSVNINYNPIINFVGISSAANINYTLVIEGSNSVANININNPLEWTNLSPPVTTRKFTANITEWYNLVNANPYRYYRIRETANAILNITNIQFNNSIVDTTMTEIPRYQYNVIPDKFVVTHPTVFYVDYQLNPTLTVWQVPSTQYKCMFYSAQEMIQTGVNYTDTLQIPSLFYDCVRFGLAADLAIKYQRMDKYDALYKRYETSLIKATVKNKEEQPLYLLPS